MTQVNPLFLIPFFIIWATMMGSYLYFLLNVAPSALWRWAEERGYQIIEKRSAGPLEWWSYARGSGHRIYRVVILDEEGQTRRGLVRVGTPYRFCLSSSRCPVEVRWDSLREPPQRIQAVTRRTVLCFAAADFLVAILVLAVELGLLFAIALCLDEIWDGALGLNRRLGRVLRPAARDESRLVMVQTVGFLALYLPALVTLTAGGIGMIRRKLWGYYSHVAGSALVALTGFGLIYAIPSLTIALRPAFKEYFRGPAKLKPGPVPVGDL